MVKLPFVQEKPVCRKSGEIGIYDQQASKQGFLIYRLENAMRKTHSLPANSLRNLPLR
jgi:hypothetical protein